MPPRACVPVLQVMEPRRRTQQQVREYRRNNCYLGGPFRLTDAPGVRLPSPKVQVLASILGRPHCLDQHAGGYLRMASFTGLCAVLSVLAWGPSTFRLLLQPTR
jgi:hypothetical protein